MRAENSSTDDFCGRGAKGSTGPGETAPTARGLEDLGGADHGSLGGREEAGFHGSLLPEGGN